MIAYHASHEQFAPSHLLKLAQAAEHAGFDAIHSSDHFHPWSVRQGHSGFSFSWITAAMQAIKLPFSMVCAPGQRYHPAIVAQAIATICEMFPSRFSIEFGSGEAVNESITGEPWPSKDDRNKRLKESVQVIHDLLKGKKVTHEGLITVKNAKLYTTPTELPPFFCAAISKETAAWSGEWSDGLLTTSDDLEKVIEKANAFRQKAGSNKPVFVQWAFSFATNRQNAIDGAYDQWRSNLVGPDDLADFSQPEDFDRKTESLSKKDIEEQIPIITSAQDLYDQAQEYLQHGIDRVILHNVNVNQEEFIEAFGSVKRR